MCKNYLFLIGFVKCFGVLNCCWKQKKARMYFRTFLRNLLDISYFLAASAFNTRFNSKSIPGFTN